MTKDTIVANVTSAGALAAVLANLEETLTVLVLVTALFLNLRKMYVDYKKSCDNTEDNGE